jgi:hypothetical protein
MSPIPVRAQNNKYLEECAKKLRNLQKAALMALVEFFATKQKMAKESGDVTRWHWKN